jgi:hypothetical protein
MAALYYDLEKEQAFYEAHRTELRSKYLGKRVVIADDQVLGVYDSDREVFDEISKTREAGTFMIKYVPVDPEDEVVRIYSPWFNMAANG